MLTTMTLRKLSQVIGLEIGSYADSPTIRNFDQPVPDQLIIIDESAKGEDSLIDGRKRFFHLYCNAVQKKISWDLELSVKIVNIRKEVQATIPSQLSDIPSGILNISFIRSFLLLNKDTNSEKRLTKDTLERLIRSIYRHLINNLNSNHTNPISIINLVAELSSYLNQSDIARILRRSEGWVSETIAVSKLPLDIYAAMENRQIAYSAAVVIAKAESERERKILFQLAKSLDVRSLRDTLRFLATKPNFSTKKDAYDRLLKMFSRKIMDVGGRARLNLQVGVERSLRKFFRSRLIHNLKNDKKIPGKDPQSLVFRLKITIDGENAEDITRLSPDKVEKMRKSIMDSLKFAID